MSDRDLSRRGFIGSATAAGLALGVTAAAPTKLPGQRLSVGIVGPGGRGRSVLASFFQVAKDCGADLTAVCDIWSRGKEPKVFRQLEDMLAWEGLDAVIIATADHAHAQHLTRCVQAGKHVYCEKPFANVLDEANTAIDACRKSNCVVTLGTQRRSDPRYLAAADVVRTGVLGPIVRVQVVQNAYSPYRWRRDAGRRS